MADFVAGSGGAEDTIRVTVDADTAAAARAAEQLTRIITQTLIEGLRAIQPEMARIMASGMAGDKIADSFNQARRATVNFGDEVTKTSQDLAALIRRSQALQATLAQTGRETDLFAVYDTQVRRLIELERRFQAERADLAFNPERLEAIRAESRQVINLLNSEQVAVGRVIEDGRSRNVAIYQQETTLRNAQIRTAGALAVAQEQRTARARIEAFRFAVRQMMFLEEQLARALRATARGAGQAVSAIGAGLVRVATSLRRNSSEFNEGLQGALTQRERAISRSFSRQNQIIETQSRNMEALQRKSQTGLFGLLSGRSAAAGALGVGGILGGGLLGGGLLAGGLERFTSIERITIQLERLTGSARETQSVLKDLTELARITPLELTDLSQTAVGLLAAGTGLRELVPFVESLADAIGFTGGGAEQLQRVALAIRQIASIGRLQGEELRQLAESLPGLNIPKLLADQLTKGDTGLLNKMVEQGKVSAQAFTEAFSTALSSDQRIVGAATATVNTLGGQIDIMKETFKVLGATIIEAIQPLLLFSIQGTTRRLEFLSDLIRGDVNPALKVLRTALLGVAAGIAALLVARAAGEALQFLAIGLRAVLTPMGILVLAVALLGGAIAVLHSNSELWARVMEQVGTKLAELIPFLDVTGDGFVTFGEILNGRIMPALSSFADFAGGALVSALRFGLGFVVNVIVPGFALLAGLIVNTLIPAIVSFATAVANRAVPVFSAIADGLAVVVEFIDPAIQGFLALGDAVVAAFGGDFSGLLNGLKAAGAGIGTVFANLGELLYNAIKPQVERAIGFIGGALGKIDIADAVFAIARIARQIGFILGNVISDPRLLDALRQIALAGAIIALNFLRGFAEGVISNLPAIADLVANTFFTVLLGALKAVFTNPKLLVAVLTAALAGPVLFRALKNIGKNWGTMTADGTVAGLKSSTANFAKGTRAFFQSAETVQVNAARKVRENTVREYRRLVRDIEAVGGTVKRPIRIADIDQQSVRNLRSELNKLTKDMTEVQRQALIARGQMNQFFRGVGQVGQGIRQTFRRDIEGATSSFRVGLNNMRTAMRDWGQDLRARGTTLGQTLGAGMLGGLTAALAGQAGGKAGLLGVITAAIGTGLSTGSPLIAGIVGGIGLISLAFKQGKADAEAFAQKVDDLVVQFRNLETALEFSTTIAENARDAFSETFDEAQELALLKALPKGFLTEFGALVGGGELAGGAQTFALVASSIGLTTSEVEALNAAFFRTGETPWFGDLDDQLIDLRAKLFDVQLAADTAGADPAREAQLKAQIAAIELISAEAEKAGIDLDLLSDVVGVLLGEIEGSATAMEIAALQERAMAEAAVEAAVAQRELTHSSSTSADALERQAIAAGITGNAFLDALRFAPAALVKSETFLRELFNQIVETGAAMGSFNFEEWLQGWTDSGDEIATTADQLEIFASLLGAIPPRFKAAVKPVIDGAALISEALEQLNKQRTDALNQQIEEIRTQLEGAETAADEAREALTEFLTGRYVDTAQAKVDDLIGNLGSIGSELESASQLGGIRGEAAFRSALGGFESQIAEIIQAGFEQGMRTQSEFATLLAPLFGAVDEEFHDSLSRIIQEVGFDFGIDEEAANAMRGTINDALAGGQIEAGITAIINADAEVARIEAELAAQEAELGVTVIFSKEQVQQALIEAGLDAELMATLNFDNLTITQIGGLAAAIAAANAVFNNPTGGLPGPVTPPAEPAPTVNNDIDINITGVTDPAITALEVMHAQNAAVAGRSYVAVGGIVRHS